MGVMGLMMMMMMMVMMVVLRHFQDIHIIRVHHQPSRGCLFVPPRPAPLALAPSRRPPRPRLPPRPASSASCAWRVAGFPREVGAVRKVDGSHLGQLTRSQRGRSLLGLGVHTRPAPVTSFSRVSRVSGGTRSCCCVSFRSVSGVVWVGLGLGGSRQGKGVRIKDMKHVI